MPGPFGSPVNTSVTFCAHQDDDLLFMNPDIIRDIQAGMTSWTVYLTAGEVPQGGRTYWGLPYAEMRVTGVKAAYARAAKVTNAWTYDPLKFGAHTVPTWTLNGTKVRLVFTYIHAAAGPDDNQGDLYRMFKGLSGPTYAPINGDPVYTRASFIEMIRGILAVANPAYIRSGSSVGHRFVDHVDHVSATMLVHEANTNGIGQTLVRQDEYEHYQITGWPATVQGYWLTEKQAVWNQYWPQDPELHSGSWVGAIERQGWQVGRIWYPGALWVPPDDFIVNP